MPKTPAHRYVERVRSAKPATPPAPTKKAPAGQVADPKGGERRSPARKPDPEEEGN